MATFVTPLDGKGHSPVQVTLQSDDDGSVNIRMDGELIASLMDNCLMLWQSDTVIEYHPELFDHKGCLHVRRHCETKTFK